MDRQSQVPIIKDPDENLIPVSRAFATSMAKMFGPKTNRNLGTQTRYSRRTISGYVWPKEVK